jgi:membrane protease YdiL (CAAX protease family)
MAVETRQQTSFRAFIKRRAVLTFYVLVFALAYGSILIGYGPGALLGMGDFMGADAEMTSATDMDPNTLLSLFTGAPTYALLGILLIALAYGRVGLRDLRSRLCRWRVGVRWYAVALLTAPLLTTAILFALSLTSQAYLPAIITAEDKASLLVFGLVAGLVTGFFEELAWTGFAAAELRKRHGVLVTGLIVGLAWCLLHLPIFAAIASGAVPVALEVAAAFFWMLPYRVLMVWVYDRTQSVLMAMLMHLPLDVCAAVLTGSPAMAGVPGLVFNFVFGATLWVVVAAVVAADRKKLWRPESGQPSRRPGPADEHEEVS